MNMDLQVDEESRLIKVNAAGLLNQSSRKEILLAVAEQLRISGFSRVLIDVTEAKFNPDELMAGAIELTSFMKSIGIRPNVKMAFIYSEAETHRKHFEDVAQFSGFNIKYHKSLEEALQWLNW